MKKYLAVLCALCVLGGAAQSITPMPGGAALPALAFTLGTTNNVNCGSGSSLDDLAAGTVLAWVYPATTPTDMGIANKYSGGAGYRNFTSATGGNLRYDIDRVTADLTVASSSAPLTSGAWQFVAVVWDTAGAAGDQKLYHGTLTSAVAEVSAYVTQTLGSGAVTSDAASSMFLGNFGAVTWGTWDGRIAWVGLWNRKLTLEEIRTQQMRPYRSTGNVLFMHLGWTGTGTQADLSGNVNNGTVTGATRGDHAPVVVRAR